MNVATPNFTGEDAAELVAVRRDLHQHPELGFEEVRTAGVICPAQIGVPTTTKS